MSGDLQRPYPGPTDTHAGPVRRGGPEKCSFTCSECSGEHHFSDPMIDSAEELPGHAAAKLGVTFWWQCKHCPAWKEWTGDEDEEDALDELDDVRTPDDFLLVLGNAIEAGRLSNVRGMGDLGTNETGARVALLLLADDGDPLELTVRARPITAGEAVDDGVDGDILEGEDELAEGDKPS